MEAGVEVGVEWGWDGVERALSFRTVLRGCGRGGDGMGDEVGGGMGDGVAPAAAGIRG